MIAPEGQLGGPLRLPRGVLDVKATGHGFAGGLVRDGDLDGAGRLSAKVLGRYRPRKDNHNDGNDQSHEGNSNRARFGESETPPALIGVHDERIV
jgi:hypothetical protein